MTTSYYFAAFYKKNGVGTAPSSVPTITIRDTTNGSTVATAQTMSAVTALTGMYSYSYSGADGSRLLAISATTDTTMDETDIGLTPEISDTIFTNLNGTISGLGARLPTALTTNGYMKSSLLEIISTALSEGATGRIAAAWQAFWNVTSPVATAQSVNQTGDSYARLGAPAGASVSADVAAVNAKTTNLPSDPADASDIAALFSAIPAAVWAYGTRTLSSFTTLAADVWAYATRTLTQSGASVAAVVSGTSITVTRGDTWVIALTGLGSLANMTKLYFTAKKQDVTDAQAAIQVEYSQGLLAIQGGGTITAGNASIAINDAVAGDITITVAAVEAAKALIDNYSYDVQIVRSSGTPISTMRIGQFTVSQDVTLAVS